MDRDSLTRELIELATAFQTGAATDDEHARLERLLEDSAQARAIYIQIADDTVTLNDVRSGSPLLQRERGGEACALTSVSRIRGSKWRFAGFSAIAASVTIAATSLWFLNSSRTSLDEAATSNKAATFARILNLSNVDWAEGGSRYAEWDRLGSQNSMKLKRGRVEILYDNGVQFLVQGPADLTFVSEQLVAAASGKLVARVSPEAIGFKITTPHAAVIDRGTAFGVSVDPELQTDVVVYEGMVDLALGESDAKIGPRLEAGEALRIGRDGQMGRISSVASDLFLPPPSLGDPASPKARLIASVSDNLKSSQTAKYYRVVSQGFREDCQAFVDRHHQWNGLDDRGIPPFLEGADYVMTFNDDKVNAELRIAVTLERPARLCVLVDDRAPKINWLAEGFVDTGWDIGIDEGYDDVETVKTAVGAGRSVENTCSIWVRDVTAPSTVLLGSLRDVAVADHPRDVQLLMYGIVAVELPMTGSGHE